MILESRDLRRHLLKAVGPILGVTVVSYFVYHSLEGDRGLWSYYTLSQTVESVEKELADLHVQRMALEKKVQLLRPDSLDLDLLEKQVRYLLGYGHPDEIVVFVEGEK